MKTRLTVAEAAEHFGLSTATVRRRCAAGTLRAEKVGRSWVIDTVEPTAAQPIEDYVWCTDCGEPHSLFDDGTLNLIGVAAEDLPCQTPKRVKTLPEDWERTYEAFPAYSTMRGRTVPLGYDLYEKSPKIDPAIHRPMYYLEAE